MRMCILGGGGYLGQFLAQALQNEEGHFVVLFDLNFSTSFPHIKLNENLTKRIEGSIENFEQLIKALKGCDACFHLAGYGMSGGPSLNKQKCFDINYWGTKNVIEIVVIFNGQKELIMADENTTPYLKYYESKAAAEQIILAENNPPKLSTCALRLRGIYGPGELRMVKRFVDFLCGPIIITFSKSIEPITQFSSVENTINALLLSEKSLRIPNSPTAGNKYHILDGGPPVNSWGFWNPLAKALNSSGYCIHVPYSFVYIFAFISELLYYLFGIEPRLTRYEIALIGVTHTFSIKRAQKDFGYNPVRSHNLNSTIEFCLKQKKEEEEKLKEKQQKQFKNISIYLTNLFFSFFEYNNWLWIVWIFDLIWSKKSLIILSKCLFLFIFFLIANDHLFKNNTYYYNTINSTNLNNNNITTHQSHTCTHKWWIF
ncbi:3Beta_HSD domain-containing protein [Meloidogyne graminicola]|uniref:3Beta_HSD domain-containing protein n=1 Tax=Meloidogyne graminicola TaxID=189291 RepID=A0A8S9ZPE4_9BILA|nr:3Beta_HSD domain-containing protein [Meloidogyne graminicola]